MKVKHKSIFLKGKAIGLAFGSLAFAAVVLESCTSDPLSPGVEFMPDMYRSPSYESYASNPVFPDSMEAMQPPKGTIPRGWYQAGISPYPYPETNEGYEMAGAELKNPIPYSDEVLKEGEVLYGKFCVHCHGTGGMGDGAVVAIGGFPPPPPYSGPALKSLPEGKMYHTITYGKNLMGSHASQLTPEERWKVIHYVQKLQNPEAAKAAPAQTLLTETKEGEVKATDVETTGVEAGQQEKEENKK